MSPSLSTTGATTLVVLNRFYQKIKEFQHTTKVERIIATNIKEYLPFLLSIGYTLLKEKKESEARPPKPPASRRAT